MGDSLKATFSERISELKQEKEISSHDLATVVGVDRRTIDCWRSGDYQLQLNHAIKLADFFECSLEYLMGRSDDVTKYTFKPCPPFYSRFLAVLGERGITTYRLRKDSPIKGGHLSKWKEGCNPLMVTLITVANYLDVSLDYLVGRES